jgi:hypothetical protein
MTQNNQDTNFQDLFDGNSFDGWRMVGKGNFNILQKENILQPEGGLGLLWYCKRKFKDFILELEWKASSEECNLTRAYLSDSQIQEMILVLLSTTDMKYR